MPNANANQADESKGGLLPLAEKLAQMAHALAQALPNVIDEEVRSSLAKSLEGMRAVHIELRSMDLLFDPEHARQIVRHAEGLRRLALATGEVVADLSLANEQAGMKLAEHVQELDTIAKLPAAAGIASRLRSTVAQARKMAADIGRALDEITRKATSAMDDISALENELRSIRERALLDALTRVHSRRALDELLAAAIERGEVSGTWCFLLAEIDHAAQVIEAHGHVVGDALLFRVARTMEEALPRGADSSFLARFGAMQFAAILFRTELAHACVLAEGLRNELAAARWQRRDRPSLGVVQVTVSIGVAQVQRADTAASLVQRAEQAVRAAQEAGGNRVVTA